MCELSTQNYWKKLLLLLLLLYYIIIYYILKLLLYSRIFSQVEVHVYSRS